MKMKKMLAILAALSVLGTTGLTVGAEDTATTTEPATEAITTTETEAETTAAETTAETETTVEMETTTEEAVVDGTELSRYTFSLNGMEFTAVLFEEKYDGIGADLNYLLTIYKGSSVTNLNSVIVNYKYDTGTESASKDVKDYISVSNDVVTISNHSGVSATYTSYIYDTNKDLFVEGDEAPTTTTTTAAETTTTTTTTTTSEADLEAAKKALYEVYAAKYKPAVSGYETVEYHIVDGVLTSATIVVEDQDEKVVKTFFVTKDGATLINSVRMGGMWYGFKSTDFTCNGYQFYAQIVQPASDADVRSYLTIYVYDKDGNLVPTNINGMQIGSVLYTGVDGKTGWTQGYDWVLSDFFSSNGDSITINRSIAAFIDVSTSMQYTLTSDSTTYTYDAATNTFVATNATNNGSNDGKTDNGSASNAPATKNTSGTPKTGDTTTVPAVAVGLTLTAAGVVAFISKRKK